jgi:hypothetical protein
MYTPAQLLTAISKEFAIIKHLASKVTPEIKDAKLSETQRSIEELETYILSLTGQVAAIIRGWWDNDVFMQDIAFTQGATYETFAHKLDEAYDIISTHIQNLSNTQRQEEVSMRWQTRTRTSRLVEYVLVFLWAYKMQLFLQLKHAGLTQLNTMNLWAGIDGN